MSKMGKLSKRTVIGGQLMDLKMKEKIRLLVDGQLPENQVKDLIRMPTKDPDRFWTYLQVLQERVAWDDTMLLRISEHLYIVQKEEGGKVISRVVKCDCGHEFGDYRTNWKLQTMIAVRKTTPELEEVYNAGIMPDLEHLEVREFYCPGCSAQLGVEVAPHGYPIVFELLPDLDSLYREWLGRPLVDESPDWFQDRSSTLTAAWAKEVD